MNKRSLTYLAIASAILLTADVNANFFSNTKATSETTTTTSDQDLTQKINKEIKSGWFSKGYEGVSASVSNGNVVLTGQVKTQAEKDKVEKEVRNIDGVRSLDSQIAVQDKSTINDKERQFPQDSYASSADEQLNKRIREAVSLGWFWNSYNTVSLNTSDGIVTLEGTVKNMKDQQKLMTDIQKVDGVKSVKSNLIIK